MFFIYIFMPVKAWTSLRKNFQFYVPLLNIHQVLNGDFWEKKSVQYSWPNTVLILTLEQLAVLAFCAKWYGLEEVNRQNCIEKDWVLLLQILQYSLTCVAKLFQVALACTTKIEKSVSFADTNQTNNTTVAPQNAEEFDDDLTQDPDAATGREAIVYQQCSAVERAGHFF